MIKILYCKKNNYHFELNKLLNKRLSGVKINSNVVKNIISDVRKNGDKALIKYEMRYGKNNEIIPKKKKNKAMSKDNVYFFITLAIFDITDLTSITLNLPGFLYNLSLIILASELNLLKLAA